MSGFMYEKQHVAHSNDYQVWNWVLVVCETYGSSCSNVDSIAFADVSWVLERSEGIIKVFFSHKSVRKFPMHS